MEKKLVVRRFLFNFAASKKIYVVRLEALPHER
nr:MAG TPA: hypothetical protein [Caudoviricetes sp.]